MAAAFFMATTTNNTRYTGTAIALHWILALALIGHLRRGMWRPEGRPLTGKESAYSVGLFVTAVLICGGAAFAALVPLAGSVAAIMAAARRRSKNSRRCDRGGISFDISRLRLYCRRVAKACTARSGVA